MRTMGLIPGLVLAAMWASACDDAPGDEGGGGGGVGVEPVLKDVSGVTFVAGVTNPYFPLPVGATWTYEASTEDGLERIEIEVLAAPVEIEGVSAVAVQDTVTLDGVIVEDTTDWYAQDSEGNVWYLGEDTCEFENGVCTVHAGAWKWGEDGALPGIIMPAAPAVDGQPYRQEWYPGEAEDVAEVVEIGVAVTVQGREYTDCITTHDTSTLDPSLDEQKTYCRGVGNVKVIEPDATVELTESTGL